MTNEITVPFNFNPYPHQAELYRAMDGVEGKPETKKLRAFLRWHRRAGKDKACFCYMIKEAMRIPGNYYYVFPQLSDARRALWENVDGDGFRTIEHIPTQIITRKREDEMSIQLISGSIIRLLGLDNPDKIRGISAKGVVFSEFGYQPPEGYKIFMPALRQANGWCIFNSTPNGKNHLYELEQRVKHEPTWYISVLQTLWADRPNYSGQVKDEALREIQMLEGLTQDQMESEYGVSYTAATSGAYYVAAIEMARESKRIGNFDYNPALGVDTFWDLGMSDSTVVWFVQFDGNRIILIDYYEDHNKTLSHYVNILRNKGYNYRTLYLPHDGRKTSMLTGTTTAQQFEELLAQSGVTCDVVVTDKPARVQDGINKLRMLMSRMYFNENRVHDGIKKLEIYKKKFNKVTNTYMDEPFHDDSSHAADALRTLAVANVDGYDGIQRPTQRFAVSDFNIYDLLGDNR